MRLRATILAGCAALAAAMGVAHAGEGSARRAPSAEAAWLAAHNRERAAFGSAPLAWNAALADEARAWAARLARENVLRHSARHERGGTGENLWMGSAGYYSPSDMIAAFTGEKRHFRAGTFPHVSRTGNWADVGHYTQVVWADTREVGCAAARGPQFDVLVCRYWPAGNVMGERIAPARLAVR
ncbi:CAP domain-containing protein [Erythrobacter sp. HL-111]|uniref:CAP domain-containing protein n=1 Tax=Erythrobacter sp. HL-111 TaxID=1798193 RepID=UPI0006D9A444|nr:CAP domain-containing protein [Erythrobacter sp. HL-111]KPP86389.1 MAG: Cysteine-rich secretory protein family [Erythrobacteraceae bacterium HL-111]SDR94339.1 Cysteine-rich secretory protein family protein [Erythrobacter sp. HL-111]